MARRTRAVLLFFLLLAVAVAVAVAAANPSALDLFARARRALGRQPTQDSGLDSAIAALNSPAPAPRHATPPLLALPSASTGNHGPPRAPPAPRRPTLPLLALPAASSDHHAPPPAPPAPPTSQRQALPSGRPAAPTCTFIAYIGGGGAEVVRGGDGRVFVVGPGDMVGASDAPPTDSNGNSEEEEEDEDGEQFTAAMNKFCEAYAYARTFYSILEWLMK